jgi:predicted ATP-grasp superfamily ATP-dependent carboligase
MVTDKMSMRSHRPGNKVLLTYGWCRTAYVAAECLAAAGYEVFACDASRVAMLRFSRNVKAFFRVPSPSTRPESYARAIAEIVADENIDVIAPVHEDMLILQRYRDLFPSRCIFACPDLSKLITVMDKAKFYMAALDAGLFPPKTLIPANIDDAVATMSTLDFPVIIKIRNGNSARGFGWLGR